MIPDNTALLESLPKISVITPSFNQGKYIERTILSVIGQGYPNLEFIIIDGGSTDNTIDIIRKYEQHISFWISESDRGQSHAINKGLSHASGDIINWLNSDDKLGYKALFKLAEAFKDPGTNIVCGYANYLTFKGTRYRKRTPGPANIPRALGLEIFVQPATFFRKKIFEELTPLDESLHFMMDQYTWLKYICRYGYEGVKYVDDTLACVLMHDDAKSVRDLAKFQEDSTRIYSALFSAMGSDPKHDDNSLFFRIDFKPLTGMAGKIKFYLTYDKLFYRDALAGRTGLNREILLLLLFRYPFSFLSRILNKLMSKFRRSSIWSAAVFRQKKSYVPGQSLTKPVALFSSKKIRTGKKHPHIIADPFLFANGEILYMFSEQQMDGGIGKITAHSTRDLLSWNSHGIVLEENFHLSYPYVFKHGEDIYMIPETLDDASIRLYKASGNILKWTFVKRIIEGDFIDPSPFFHEGTWYLFTMDSSGYLRLFFSPSLTEGWKEHPSSPLTDNKKYAQPGGVLFMHEGRLFRPVQDCSESYGKKLHLMQVKEISPFSYREEPAEHDILRRNKYWNNTGGHHLHTIEWNGQTVIAIDGKSNDYLLNKLLSPLFRIFS